MAPQMCMAAVLTGSTNLAAGKASNSSSVELSNIRWLVHKDGVEGTSKLRLVIDTTGPVKVSGTLDEKTGTKLTIDIKDAAVGKVKSTVALDGDIGEKVTFSKKNTTNSQVVVDLSNMIEDSDYKIFTLPVDTINNKSFRVVIDINKPVPKIIYNFTPGLKGKVIVIDAGHGGSDPGAIGPNKTQEKRITLSIAQKVKALLEKAGAKVLMTRQTDVDVYGPNASAVEELSARTKIANNNKADAFVSIHINAFSNATVGGISTYYYQKTGYDAMLAKNIQNNIDDIVGFEDRGINSAGFYVIKRTQMPAVLLELGFISNPEEEKLMNMPQVQQQMGQGIVKGLESFFAQAAKKGGGS